MIVIEFPDLPDDARWTTQIALDFAEKTARQNLAPLLQDLAAHEASNRIKSENLETLRQQLADAQADAVSWQQQASDRVKDWDSLREQNAKLREALEGCLAVIERADTSEGVCCCGDDMERHGNPLDCGHSPVDAGDYHSGLVVKAARAALGESNG